MRVRSPEAIRAVDEPASSRSGQLRAAPQQNQTVLQRRRRRVPVKSKDLGAARFQAGRAQGLSASGQRIVRCPAGRRPERNRPVPEAGIWRTARRLQYLSERRIRPGRPNPRQPLARGGLEPDGRGRDAQDHRDGRAEPQAQTPATSRRALARLARSVGSVGSVGSGCIGLGSVGSHGRSAPDSAARARSPVCTSGRKPGATGGSSARKRALGSKPRPESSVQGRLGGGGGPGDARSANALFAGVQRAFPRAKVVRSQALEAKSSVAWTPRTIALAARPKESFGAMKPPSTALRPPKASAVARASPSFQDATSRRMATPCRAKHFSERAASLGPWTTEPRPLAP
jgi:hypothetical protein